MFKYCLFYALVFSILILTSEAGSYHRQTPKKRSPLLKREDCDISCNGELANCADRCYNSRIGREKGRDAIKVVCQSNMCYCGFEAGDDR
ncbi:hypothetical protein AB4K20DRAFT_1925773 [Rhizopus microsporus]|uniref:Invertebrate defensins family profile domain-containing protein n=1 Tax=Rhizopus microsporus TaxID=58291 RepID=A0A1X0RSH7_RHIZD|nr:hypothetical protein BCV71DRAFT_228938 [Rhizopus microsporus]